MLIIVPDLPPNINGLGDYAYCIAQKLKEINPLVEINFLVAGKTGYKKDGLFNFPIAVVEEQSSMQLIKEIEKGLTVDNIIHLHYVGYGYEKRGMPLWLLNGLKKAKQQQPQIKLVTTFHELFATSDKPWQSSFWNGSLQKWICKKVYILSDKVITNRQGFASVLQGFLNKEVKVLPVFSNVGEPETIKPLAKRKKQMVVFGSAYSRQYTYTNYHKEIEDSCQQYGIDSIIDIGKPLAISPMFGVRFKTMGVLPAEEISAILQDSFIAFIGFPDTEWFGKSGIFAALAAHGSLIVAGGITKQTDGLQQGVHFLNPHQLSTGCNVQDIADNVWKWYQQHTVTKHANQLLEGKILNCYF